MNKVAHAFLTTLFFAVLTMLTAIAWSYETAPINPTTVTPTTLTSQVNN